MNLCKLTLATNKMVLYQWRICSLKLYINGLQKATLHGEENPVIWGFAPASLFWTFESILKRIVNLETSKKQAVDES